MLGWRCKLGLVTPIDNWILEPELRLMAPDGVSVNAARLNTMALPEMPGDAEEEAENLGTMGADVVSYACNASSFYEGPGGDERIADRLSAAAGVPATTASTAMVRALHHLDVSDVSIVTPYGEDDNERLRAFLEGNGLDVVSLSGLGLASDEAEDLAAVNEETAYDTYGRVLDADDADADAVLVTATNLQSAEALDAMETDVGKPVVSTNQAMLWHALVLAGVNPRSPGYGTLLAGGR